MEKSINRKLIKIKRKDIKDGETETSSSKNKMLEKELKTIKKK
jgi:hypothetical protein